MKKSKLLIVLIMAVISFCFGINSVSAINTSGDCSNYFKYNDIVYNEGNNGGLVDNVYTKEESNAKIFVGGNPKGETYNGDVEDETVTSAWYFSACNDAQCPYGYNKNHRIESNLKLVIDVYKKDSTTKLCTWSISGFDSSKSRVKVRLQHQGVLENITMKGYFEFGNNSTGTSELSMTIKNTTTELNTEKGTRTANDPKEDILKTSIDEDGNTIILNSKSTSCTDVKEIIDDYWKYIIVIVPILLIMVLTLDFFKAMGSNDADAIKKAGTNAVKRTVAAVILLALPALLSLILGWFDIPLCI